MNVPGDSRTFFYNPGTNDALAESDIPVEAIAAKGVKFFYLGYLNLMGRLDRVDARWPHPGARVLGTRASGRHDHLRRSGLSRHAQLRRHRHSRPAAYRLSVPERSRGARATGLNR